jgi:transcription-repair coupling factor (superfamily II helicase)
MSELAIGTHRLLNEDVRLKRLGLVVIDEEHRFGVRQKERL